MDEIKIEYKTWYRFKSSKARNDFLCNAIKQYEGIDKAIRDIPIYRTASCLRVTTNVRGEYDFNYRTSYNPDYMAECILYDPDNFEKHKKESIKNMVDASIDVDYGRMSEDTIVNNYYSKTSKRITDDIIKRRKRLIESTNTYKLIDAYIKDMNILFNRQGRKEAFSYGQDIEALCAYEVKSALTNLDEEYKERMDDLGKRCSECVSLIRTCLSLDERLKVYKKFGIKVGV